jgi:hypothetical protein
VVGGHGGIGHGLLAGKEASLEGDPTPDTSGVDGGFWIYLTADGRSYVYNYKRDLSTLHLVQRLR